MKFTSTVVAFLIVIVSKTFAAAPPPPSATGATALPGCAATSCTADMCQPTAQCIGPAAGTITTFLQTTTSKKNNLKKKSLRKAAPATGDDSTMGATGPIAYAAFCQGQGLPCGAATTM